MEFNATFLISAISFILFVIIMNFIFYKPIEKIVNERQNFIDGNYDEAQKNNANAQNLIDERERMLTEANFQGKTIMNEKSLEAKNKKTSLINEAQKNAVQKIYENQNELENAFDTAKSEISNKISELASEMSNKLFGEKVVFNNQNNKNG